MALTKQQIYDVRSPTSNGKLGIRSIKNGDDDSSKIKARSWLPRDSTININQSKLFEIITLFNLGAPKLFSGRPEYSLRKYFQSARRPTAASWHRLRCHSAIGVTNSKRLFELVLKDL